jgi:anti-repressor protein
MKRDYFDVILDCKDSVPIGVIAEDYGESAQRLNKKLLLEGVQYRQDGAWFLQKDYAEYGYTESKSYNCKGRDGKPYSVVRNHWTQKGRLFIYRLLKSQGILPKIEMPVYCQLKLE